MLREKTRSLSLASVTYQGGWGFKSIYISEDALNAKLAHTTRCKGKESQTGTKMKYSRIKTKNVQRVSEFEVKGKTHPVG